jgi:hypothetical protein
MVACGSLALGKGRENEFFRRWILSSLIIAQALGFRGIPAIPWGFNLSLHNHRGGERMISPHARVFISETSIR